MEHFITVKRSKSVRNANDIQNETNESEKDRDLSISNAEDNSDGGASDDQDICKETPSNANPWPYIESYFRFVGIQGKNCQFICLNCPSVSSNSSTLSIKSSFRSNTNLRRHLTRKHPGLVPSFDKVVARRKYLGAAQRGYIEKKSQ